MREEEERMAHQNRLSGEKSPYLLQHADNPIDWYPWGEEAFKKAKDEDKPVFLSIGYSTCHWCHVMAHESFEDSEVALYMNENYVAIKVDREERPDIDSIYMKVCQMMTGHGGWPLTIIMTPDKIPFYAGTYFPREGRYNLPGILDVLSQVFRIYKEDKIQLADIEKSVLTALNKTVQRERKEGLSKEAVEKAFQELGKMFDPVFGGFGTTQKFPQPQNLLFLLHYYQVTGEKKALQMVEQTLTNMIKGGIWDHIGFGFSRYTVDRRWQTPHFEKMLYDNALLLMALTTCYQITKNPLYKKISKQLISFVEREMTSKEGAFYSAIDADSEGEEGKFYVWDFVEIYQLLAEDRADIFSEVYGLSPLGNFEGKNILRLPNISLASIAEEHHLTEKELEHQLEESRQRLFNAREKRVRPHLDDKVLTSWNSLMIAALARAGFVFEEEKNLQMAEKALTFIEGNLYEQKRLMARYRDGEVKHLAYLDDYAFLAWAYLEMYGATFELNYLRRAVKITEQMDALFWDKEEGGFYFSGQDAEEMIVREKEITEGAMPSGNSIASLVYAKLAMLTGDSSYSDHLYSLYQVFHDDIAQAPSSAPSLLQSLLLAEYRGKQVVIVGNPNANILTLIEEMRNHYLPNVVLLLAENSHDFAGIADFASNYTKLDDQATIYVCENFTCQLPTTSIQQAFTYILD